MYIIEYIGSFIENMLPMTVRPRRGSGLSTLPPGVWRRLAAGAAGAQQGADQAGTEQSNLGHH